MEDVKYSVRDTGSDVKSLNTRCSSCCLEEGEFRKSKARYRRDDEMSSLSHETACFHSIVPNKRNFSNQNLRGKNSIINATLHLKFQRTCSPPRPPPPHTHSYSTCMATWGLGWIQTTGPTLPGLGLQAFLCFSLKFWERHLDWRDHMLRMSKHICM